MAEELRFGTDAERVRSEQTARGRRLPGARTAEVVPPPAIALVVTATLLGTTWR
jgi:hypothetical protein